MSAPAIEAINVSKKFTRDLHKGLSYGLIDSIKTMVGITPKNSVLRAMEFWALKDVGFALPEGKSLGLLGTNGSGKSTLLRLISGIYPPSEGLLKVRGRVGSLIAVGAGFHPHMTGRENIFLNGAIMGMSSAEIKKRFDQIIDFAQVEDFINSPVATYSSGMTLRIAFSIAVHGSIDILLADEILAVGDQAFRERCTQKMKDLQSAGVSLILVSHIPNQIAENCDHTILIHKGVQEFYGDVSDGLAMYQELQDRQRNVHKRSHTQEQNSYVHIDSLQFSPKLSDHKIMLSPKQSLDLTFAYHAQKDYEHVDVKVFIHVPFFNQGEYIKTSNLAQNIPLKIKKGTGSIITSIENLPFSGLEVMLSVEVWDAKTQEYLYGERDIRVEKTHEDGMTGYGYIPVSFKVIPG